MPKRKDSDLLSLGIGPEHVKRLHDELARLLELAEKGWVAQMWMACLDGLTIGDAIDPIKLLNICQTIISPVFFYVLPWKFLMILVCDPCSLQKDRCDQATGDGQSHADVVLGGLHQWGEGCSFGMAKHSTLKLLRFLNWWGVGRNLNGVGKKYVTVNRSSTCFNGFDWVCLLWHNDLGLIDFIWLRFIHIYPYIIVRDDYADWCWWFPVAATCFPLWKAIASLKPETADEEALQQLSERQGLRVTKGFYRKCKNR